MHFSGRKKNLNWFNKYSRTLAHVNACWAGVKTEPYVGPYFAPPRSNLRFSRYAGVYHKKAPVSTALGFICLHVSLVSVTPGRGLHGRRKHLHSTDIWVRPSLSSEKCSLTILHEFGLSRQEWWRLWSRCGILPCMNKVQLR